MRKLSKEIDQDYSETFTGWETPKITWINGVPGCGKTTWIVQEFDNKRDYIVTTTIEAAEDLKGKLANRIRAEATTKLHPYRHKIDSFISYIAPQKHWYYFRVILSENNLASTIDLDLGPASNFCPEIFPRTLLSPMANRTGNRDSVAGWELGREPNLKPGKTYIETKNRIELRMRTDARMWEKWVTGTLTHWTKQNGRSCSFTSVFWESEVYY
ncbi:hypothetical protein EVAR_57426_1 [Eumeta japonica]|uniref:(+)RNA virus helicase C-terminal domain-containing protein n=1 Tax=Eumeta variegata TaxID=151549 RepID=A0A4C1YCX0_EUMVA|nr:hypothetical protein EVAR_57426_1 [Eumeta japonica]